MKLALFWVALGGMAFLVASFTKKERWFKFLVSAGGFWLACGVAHLIRAVM